MKTIIATTAALIISGSAMAGGFPCTKAQLWVTSLPTVHASAEMHRDTTQVNIATLTLKPRQKTNIAQASAISVEQSI